MAKSEEILRRRIARKVRHELSDKNVADWPNVKCLMMHVEGEVALLAKSLKEEMLVHTMFQEIYSSYKV